MKGETANLVMNYVTTKCPLCDETFRTKYILRTHIKRHHTEEEAEKFIASK